MTGTGNLTISRLASRASSPTPVAFSWQEFAALFADPYRVACTVESCCGSACPHKEGGCWSPAVFRGDRRVKQEVEAVSCLVLDVDHATEARVAGLLDKLAAYQYVLHTTHADRRDNRCMRVVVQLTRPVMIDEWPRFWQAATLLFGTPMDPSCGDVARCYYLPSRPRDADYVVVEHAGAPLEVSSILASRRSMWDLVIDYVEGRRSALRADVVDLVVADMRTRGGVDRQPCSIDKGREHLVAAYQRSLDLAVCLSNELDEHGATLDDVPVSWRLVRVQAMLCDHVRTIVQLRALIEEGVP